MSKFVDVYPETQELFDQVLESTLIPNWVEIKLMANNSQKELYTIRKVNELFEVLTNGLSIVLILNEEIFDKLEEEQQKLVFEEALTGVHVSDTDKISIEKYDFSTYSGMLQKHGDETMIKLKESIISLFDEKRQEEAKQKE
ncbi:MAG: putative metallopeptidase [bacterium]